MLKKDKNFEFAFEIIELNKDKINTNIKEFLYNCIVNHPIVTDEILIYILYIFDEADILPPMSVMVDYFEKEKDQLFLSGTVKQLYSKIKEIKDTNTKLKENLSNFKLAQEIINDNPDIFAVLYGWEFKQQPPVEIYPEEFYSYEELRRRIDQIVRDYHKYSSNPVGNRYAKESDFYFYVKYKGKKS